MARAGATGGPNRDADTGPAARTGLGDLVAGLAIAGLLLPEAVAYAGIAGLPPQHALFAAMAGCVVYPLVGRSRFAVVAPTSSSAAILAAALANLPGDPAGKVVLASAVVWLTGVFFVVASLLRLGGLTGFISRPVLKGFAFGLAVTIILRQMPLLLGLDVHAATPLGLVPVLAERLGDTQAASLATGLVTLVALLGLRRWPALPAAFAMLGLGILASRLLDLPARGVATVGQVALALTWPGLPDLTLPTLSHVAQLTLPLVLILFAESWGSMRSLGLLHAESLDPDRELRALGVANLACALLNGMPVGAGFSAGSLAEAAGARTRAASLIGGLGLLALVVGGAGLVADLPEPVLAAIVVAALVHALDPRPFRRLWQLDRDRWLGPAAALGVLLLGVVDGMLLAIGLSLVALLRRLASPIVVELGRLGDGHDFVDVARHPEARAPAGIAVLRPLEPLFFANAERILSLVEARVTADPAVRAVVLSLEESFDLDSTALDALMEWEARLAVRGLPVHLARTRDAIRDVLKRAGAGSLLERGGYSVDDAVRLAQETLTDGCDHEGPGGQAGTAGGPATP